MTKERRLGRGLEALLGRTPEPASPQIQVPEYPRLDQQAVAPSDDDPYGGPSQPAYGTTADADQPPESETPAEQPPQPAIVSSAEEPPAEDADATPMHLAVTQIDGNPFQPRQDFNPRQMQSLLESITAHGLLQPVVVRRVDDRFELVAGERRLRAATQAGWSEVPVRVVEADDRQAAELAIVENMQRRDLNPLEKAASFQRYLDEYGTTQEDLAARLKLDRSTISNLIRLLELPEAVQDLIRQGKITQGHARALLTLGEEQEQIDFCERIRREGLSVRQTESLVQETIEAADHEPLGLVDRDGKTSRPPRVQSEHLAALEEEFRLALGVKTKITHNARGRGKLVIHFRNHEQFEHLRSQICNLPRADAQHHVG